MSTRKHLHYSKRALRVQERLVASALCEVLIAHAVPQHAAAVERNRWIVVPAPRKAHLTCEWLCRGQSSSNEHSVQKCAACA